jgi:ATP-dependent DNA helicase RecG
LQYIKELKNSSEIFADCREAGLPEPDFEQHGPHFVVTLSRDWLTQVVMDKLGLRNRERRLVSLLNPQGRIGNQQFQLAITGSIGLNR